MATSAIWKITYRAVETTFAPILIRFSRGVLGTPYNGIKLRGFEAFPCGEGPHEPGRKAATGPICAGPNRRPKALGGLS